MLCNYIDELIDYRHEKYGPKNCIVQYQNGQPVTYTSEKLQATIHAQVRKWHAIGLKQGDRVGVAVSSGSADWLICDFSLLRAGLIPVSIQPTYHPDEWEHIIKEAKMKALIVDTPDDLSFPLHLIPPGNVLSLSPDTSLPYFQDIKSAEGNLPVRTDPTKASVIIYTSGTSGKPKGVVLSHFNILSNVTSVLSIAPVNYKSRVFSFLPVSHVFERTIIYTYLASGATIYFTDERKNVFRHIQHIRPHFMTAVPRILEKVYDQIKWRGDQRSRVQRKLIKWALHQGMTDRSSNIFIQLIDYIKTIMADILVYRHWRKALGGKIKGIGVGAAALHPGLGRLFNKAGIPIREGYGLTETSPVVTFNRFEPGGVRFGTAGMVIPGVEIKIDKVESEEGEILVRGPNVMLGYYKNPELTRFMMTDDGWFRTGDIGKIIHQRFLQITDRKKDIFKSSSGRYIAPQIIENKLRSNDFIDQCMIIGFQKPYVTALILPHFPQLKRWCLQNNVHWTSPQYIVLNPMVELHYKEEVAAFNQTLKPHERILKFHLLFKEWTISHGEYTSSLKLKRTAIEALYQKEIEEMYRN